MRYAHHDRGELVAQLAHDPSGAADVIVALEAEVERLRDAARRLISDYMRGWDLADAINALEKAAGLSQQEGL